MFKDCLNTRKQGEIGLGAAIAYFLRLGHTVSIPLCDNQKYDLVVDMQGQLKKVQVKTSRFISSYGIYKVALKTCGGNKSGNTISYFDKSLVDYVFILTDNGTLYNIPSNDIKVKGVLSLSSNMDIYKVS
jgi:hypothetical protein